MRKFTENERAAIGCAFRRFVNIMSGQRMIAKTGATLAGTALDGGITADQLLNRSNWLRAAETMEGTQLTPEMYIDLMLKRAIPVTSITDEEMWDTEMGGMEIVAEVFHDFYMEIEPKGGTWSTPRAKVNLAAAIRENTLQALMSESLIAEITRLDGRPGELTCYQYIEQILRRRDTIEINRDLTEEQAAFARIGQEEDASETDGDGYVAENGDPYFENEDGYVEETEGKAAFEQEEEIDPDEDVELLDIHNIAPAFQPTFSAYSAKKNPSEYKKRSIMQALQSFRPSDIIDLVCTIPDCNSMSLQQIVEALTEGKAQWDREDAKAKDVHQQLNAILVPDFINCVSEEGVEMDEEKASRYDILRTDWDLRDTNTRRFHKLVDAVYASEQEPDDDVVDALADLEKYYEILRKQEEEQD